jgi:hypothetical protein
MGRKCAAVPPVVLDPLVFVHFGLFRGEVRDLPPLCDSLALRQTFGGKSLNARNISHRFSIPIREKVLAYTTPGWALILRIISDVIHT